MSMIVGESPRPQALLEAVGSERHSLGADPPNITGVRKALTMLGVGLRYNERKEREEWYRLDDRGWPAVEWPAGEWSVTTDRIRGILREVIGARFCYTRSGKGGDYHYPYNVTNILLQDSMDALAANSVVDEFRDYLERLPEWDSEARLDGLLGGAFEIEERHMPLAAWAARYLMLGAIWRTYHPGCKLDEIPVLVGAQGIGKSTFGRHLFPDEDRRLAWFSSNVSLADDTKKRAEKMLGKVLIEIAELAGMSHAHLESTKAWLTAQDDTVRLAWRRDPSPLPRRVVFLGTTNDPSLPNDPTGNRRFVTLHVGRKMSVEELRVYIDGVREQLWAEALHRYRQGESAYLPSELAPLQAAVNETARRQDEAVETALAEFVASASAPFALIEAGKAAGMVNRADEDSQWAFTNRGNEHRTTGGLRLMGYERGRMRVGGKIERLWWTMAIPYKGWTPVTKGDPPEPEPPDPQAFVDEAQAIVQANPMCEACGHRTANGQPHVRKFGMGQCDGTDTGWRKAQAMAPEKE